MMPTEPYITIIILNYNGMGFLEGCIESVLKSNYSNFEAILVDNASTDGSLGWAESIVSKDSRLRIIKSAKNLLFTGGNNLGIKHARGEYIIILNNDTEVERSWLKEIALVMQDESIGAAQPKILVYKSIPLRIDYAGGDLDRYGYAKGRHRGQIERSVQDRIEEIFYAGGTAMILRSRILKEVGLFDHKFGAHWEDVDLSWRIRLRGYRIVLIPRAKVYHKGSKSMSKFMARHRVAWYVRKNRLAGLIKNYSALNLFKVLPVLTLIYFVLLIKELFLDRNIKLATSSILAVAWNIKELPYLLKERRFVQNRIRLVQDNDIVKQMQKECLAFNLIRKAACL